jgi:hypothetical protein
MQAHKVPESLAALMIAGLPGAVERQEAAGQAELCRTEVLPKDCPRAELEKFGVVFGTDHDDLFVNVTLPAGWKKQATDHSMHSDLLDEKGRKRGSIFYKAAFYDRNADMHLVRRYTVDNHFSCDEQGNPAEYGKHTHLRTVVKDGAVVIKSFDIRPKDYSRDNYKLAEQHQKDACAWLTEHFPKWEDVTAYWD